MFARSIPWGVSPFEMKSEWGWRRRSGVCDGEEVESFSATGLNFPSVCPARLSMYVSLTL